MNLSNVTPLRQCSYWCRFKAMLGTSPRSNLGPQMHEIKPRITSPFQTSTKPNDNLRSPTYSPILNLHFVTAKMVADSLVYHPSVAHYLKFVATTVGRDKLLRTLQYFSRFYAWYLFRTNGTPGEIAPFEAIKKQFGLVRKTMRVRIPSLSSSP